MLFWLDPTFMTQSKYIWLGKLSIWEKLPCKCACCCSSLLCIRPKIGPFLVKSNIQHGKVLILCKKEQQRRLLNQAQPIQTQLVPIWVGSQLALVSLRHQISLEEVFDCRIQSVGTMIVGPIVDRDTVSNVEIWCTAFPVGNTYFRTRITTESFFLIWKYLNLVDTWPKNG